MINRFPITQDGYSRMNQELQHLKNVDRPSVILAIAEARAHGDLSENAEYAAAKEKQGFVEAKIADLESKVARSEIIDISTIQTDQVQFGASVSLIDIETEKSITYKIVGDYESDLTKGYISIYSPLAQALMGKKEKQEIEVNTPKGIRYYEIVKISYNH